MDATAPGPGVLTWTVKESFLAYVGRSHGRITVVEPARAGASGFEFPSVESVSTDALDFAGGLAFSAHGGALDITLAEPVIVLRDEDLLLGFADPARPDDAERRMIVATLVVSRAAADVTSLVPALTADGSALFGSVYPEGEELDALLVPTPSLSGIGVVMRRAEAGGRR